MNLFRSTHQTMRSLWRRPGFTLMASLTLALGIGASTAVFGVAYALLVRPLPGTQPDRLVTVYETAPGHETRSVAPANFLSWRETGGVFDALAAYDERDGNLVGGDVPDRIHYATVSANYFSTLGTPAVIGRTFRDDDAATGVRSAVIRESFWRTHFHADPAIIGRVMRLDDQTLQVIGVAPDGAAVAANADVYVRALYDIPELGPAGNDIRNMRDAWYFKVVGRLSPHVSVAAAQSALSETARRLSIQFPETNADEGVHIITLREDVIGDVRPRVLLLLGAVALVLLIACANVANLLLLHATGRRRELALRIAIGAGTRRIVSQLLGESAIIAFIAAISGWAIALGFARVLANMHGAATDHIAGSMTSLGMLVLGTCVSIGTVLLFGTFPAVAAAHTLPRAMLAGRTESTRGGGRRSIGAFVVVEVGLALVLVAGAGLMLRTLQRLTNVDAGFNPKELYTMHVSVPGAKHLDPAAVRSLYDEMIAQIDAQPGVIASGVAISGPVDDGPGAGLRIASRPASEGKLPQASWQSVSPSYFRAAGIRLVSGRTFDATDRADSPPVAVINETMARERLGGTAVIGERINTGLDGQGVWVTVVGVVADTKNRGVAHATAAEMFRPLDQPSRFGGEQMMLLIRTTLPAEAVNREARAAIQKVRSDATIFDSRTGAGLISQNISDTTYLLTLLSGFAAVALLLALAGIYGVMAHSVRQRMHEIGVRLALGARPVGVLALVMRDGMRLILTGLAIGGCVSLIALRALRSMLFNVSAYDPATFVMVAVTVVVAGSIATAVPVIRAIRLDPLRVLRND